MVSFANLAATLKLNISDFSSKLNSASAHVRKFANDLSGKTASAITTVNSKTTAWGLNLKSVSRVVSGILISQTFYRILQSVNSATDAVWEFTKQLETAHVAYSNLFGDIKLAEEFINVLKDFAAKTPFSFTESEKAAKRLLAYGIEYKNVMYVMQGVLSAASIQGDSAKIESISRALGQIYTYGKLMTQEIRQLSEAGIPAYEILQEELGLTQEQLANLGNEGIKADVAINALVDGIQKRFGTAAEAAAKTTSGIISNIKDNATMLFTTLFEPFTTFIKSGLARLGEFLYGLREIADNKGIGGVFEALVPKEMQSTVRQFVATLGTLLQSIARLAFAVGGLLKPVFDALIMVFNAFAPILTLVTNAVAALVKVITNNATAMKVLTTAIAAAAAMWVVYKIKALATAVVSAVIIGVSKALAGLSAVLTFVTAHPFWALLIAAGGILVGLSGGFGALSDKISGFFKKVTSFNGIDPDKILLPSQEDRANDLDKFNNKLEGTSDAMDDLADSTGKATKAAKGLLSFDEVFKLNESDEGTDDGITDELEDLINGLGDAYIPEVPDFDDYMEGLTSGFLKEYEEAWNGVKEALTNIAGTAIGAAFGGIIGKLLGGKLGGILGIVAGAIVGHFWDKLANYFGLTPDERLNAGIIGGIGAVLGAIIGGIFGGPAGAKIGAAIGGVVFSFWGLFAEYLGVVPKQHIATAISSAISGALVGGLQVIKTTLVGALKQGVQGALVSLGVGILSNALTAWIASELELTEKDLENAGVGQLVGNIIGSIVGVILGGPIGSLVGGAFGQLAGSIIGEFWSYMNNTLKGTIIGTAAGTPIGALIGVLVGSLGGPLGAALGAAIGAALGALVGLIVDYWEPIKQFFIDAANFIGDVFISLGGIISGAWQGISDFVRPVVESLGNFISGIWNGVSSVVSSVCDSIWSVVSIVWNDISAAVSIVGNDLWTAVSTVWNDISTVVSTVCTDLWAAVSTVWNDISSAVMSVCTDIGTVVSEVWNFIRDLIVKVVTGIWNAVVTFFKPIAEVASSVCGAIWNVISTTFTNIGNTIRRILSNVLGTVQQVFYSILAVIKDVVVKVWDAVKNTFSNIYNSIKSSVSNAYGYVRDVLPKIYSSIKSNVSLSYESVKTGFANIYNGIKNTISNMYNTVKSGVSNIYNTFTNWVSNLWDNVFGKFFGWVSDGIDKLREFFGLEAEAQSSHSYSSSGSTYGYGHATGGIFNREHVARFSEGNKTEAIIPLEEQSAMQPFVDAVANGLTATLAPMLAGFNSPQQLQPLYVGTLIADDKGLRELERKMEIIRLQENRR